MSDSLWPHGLGSPWNSPGQKTGVDSLSLLQGIFLTQKLNQGLLHCRRILHQLRYQGSPIYNIYLSIYPSILPSSLPSLLPSLPVAQMAKNLPAMQETRVQSLSWEDPLEMGMATYSIIHTWRILWTEEPITKSGTQLSH